MPSWRLDGRDPSDHRADDRVRDDAKAARDSGQRALRDMLQREREREEEDARIEEERRSRRHAAARRILRRR